MPRKAITAAGPDSKTTLAKTGGFIIKVFYLSEEVTTSPVWRATTSPLEVASLPATQKASIDQLPLGNTGIH